MKVLKQQEDFLTVPEFAKRRKLSVGNVYRLTRYRGPGALPIRKYGKRILISLSEADEWAKERATATR